jgi:Protein of unknown function (DUF998)
MSGPVRIGRLIRHPVANSESLESAALLVGAGVFVLTAIPALFVFTGRSVPIAGPGSIGQFVAIASLVIAVVVFVAAAVLIKAGERTSTEQARHGLQVPGVRMHWWDVGALALAHGIIAGLGWLGVSAVLEQSFLGAALYSFPAAVLGAVAIAVTAYGVFLSAVNLTPMLLSVVLAVFLVVGCFASMLSATDPLWWQQNLSTLGISDDVSSLAFNLTLIIAGAIVIMIANFAAASIVTRNDGELRGRNRIRVALALIGILLACVGIFPVDQFFTAHNVAASGMVVVFVVTVICLRWWVPATPRVFILLGYVFVGVIVVLAVFFATGYYNLTAVELIAFLLVFGWLIVFLRNAGAMQLRPQQDATATRPAEAGSPPEGAAAGSSAAVGPAAHSRG